MDLQGFVRATVAGVPLVFVVMGLVAWAKQFRKADGTQRFGGNTLLIISMGIGLLFGGLYMLTQTRPPAGDWWTATGYWFALAVYGLAMGIVASGIYEMTKGILEKVFGQLFRGVVIDLAKPGERQ